MTVKKEETYWNPIQAHISANREMSVTAKKEKTYTHYAHTANHWALGVSLDHAKRRIRESAGKSTKAYGYQVCEFSRPVARPEIDVHPVTGELSVAEGITVEVAYTSPKAKTHLLTD